MTALAPSSPSALVPTTATVRVLNVAAKIIEERGWSRMYLVDQNYRVNVIQALKLANLEVTGNFVAPITATVALLKAVDLIWPAPDDLAGRLELWNRMQRDRRKVTRALRRAARNVRAEQG